MAQLQVLRHEKREPPSGSEQTRMHTAHGSRPNDEHHTFCMRTAQNYAISENDMLETTILTSTNPTGTLTRDDLNQPGTTYSTYPVGTPKRRIVEWCGPARSGTPPRRAAAPARSRRSAGSSGKPSSPGSAPRSEAKVRPLRGERKHGTRVPSPKYSWPGWVGLRWSARGCDPTNQRAPGAPLQVLMMLGQNPGILPRKQQGTVFVGVIPSHIRRVAWQNI